MENTISDSSEDDKKFGPIPEGEFCVYGTVSNPGVSSVYVPSRILSSLVLTGFDHQVYAKPEHADALASLYREMTKIAQTEPGVIYYCLSRNTEDPTVFHFFERYESKKAFEKHVSREETQKIMAGGWMKDVTARFERPLMPVD